MLKHRAVTAFAVLSLALGIGANTAIYSFMDAMLLRSLPVRDPASLVVVTWRSEPFNSGRAVPDGSRVRLAFDHGSIYDDRRATAGIFPFAAFERLQSSRRRCCRACSPYFPAGRVNVMIDGQAELADGEYVSGDFFRGLGVAPAAGRLLVPDDDRAGAPAVAVISDGYASVASGRRPTPSDGRF